jgi:hypothetical protein
VYLVATDSSGARTLLFPAGGTDIENRFPTYPAQADGGAAEPPLEISLRKVPVTDPLGVDTLVLLTTEKPLGNPRALEGEAITVSRGAKGPGADEDDGFLNLLAQPGKTRGFGDAPGGWTLQRLTVKTTR